MIIRLEKQIPSKNKFEGRHWGMKHKDTKDWEKEIWAACNGRPPKFPGKVRLKITSIRKTLLDPGNLRTIGLIDALKRLGVIVNDDVAHLELPEPSQIKARSQSGGQTVLEIEGVV